jgi:hypothetical protein
VPKDYPLSDFLIRLSDPRFLAAFRENPDAAFEGAGLTDADKSALLSGTADEVRKLAESEMENFAPGVPGASPEAGHSHPFENAARHPFAAEIAELPEDSETPEKSGSRETPRDDIELIEIMEVSIQEVSIAEASEILEIREISEVLEVREISEISEVLEVKEISEISEVLEVREISEVIEVKEISEISEVLEVREIFEIAEIGELIIGGPEIQEIQEIAEVAAVRGRPEGSEVAQQSLGQAMRLIGSRLKSLSTAVRVLAVRDRNVRIALNKEVSGKLKTLSTAVRALAIRDRDVRIALTQGVSGKLKTLSMAVRALAIRDRQVRMALNRGVANLLRAQATELKALNASVAALSKRLEQLEQEKR